MKKILYSFLVLFVVLIISIVVAANSSFVIKKAADTFAPDYKISYDDIKGNIFTGVKISGLKFDNKILTKNIIFSWNPSKILYKRIAIHKIDVEALDVDVLKALIASFPSEDNSTSEPFPLVVLVGKISLSVNPFEEQGIAISKTHLEVEDVTFASDALDIDHMQLQVDTNITKLYLQATLEDNKLTIEDLSLSDIDSVSLEKMFLVKENKSTTETVESQKHQAKKPEQMELQKEEPLNPLIPTHVVLKDMMASLKPRAYQSVQVDKLKVTLHDLNADVVKLISNRENAFAIDKYTLLFESSVGQIDVAGKLHKDTVTLEHINVENIDTLAIQKLIPSDNNESNFTQEEQVVAVEQNSSISKEVNHLIPKYVVIKDFHTDVLPATYDPVQILNLVLDIKDVKVNVAKLLVENASIDLKGKTNLTNFTHNSKIKDNELKGEIRLTPNKKLFELYQLPVRKEAIGDIVIDLDATEKAVAVDVRSSAKNILISQKRDNNSSDINKSKEFNVDIDSLVSHAVYTIKSKRLHADSEVMITTPYAKNISVTNTFEMDRNISYKGKINVKELIGIDTNLTKPLQNLNIHYAGDLQSVKTDIVSDGLKGSFNSADMKKAALHIETTKSIVLRDMVALPAELNNTKVDVLIDVPLDLTAITPLKANVKILSNVSNIDAELKYDKNLKAKVTSNMPEDSLLKAFDKNIKWNALNPLVADVDLGENNVSLKLKAKVLSADVKYMLETQNVDGKLQLAGLNSTIQGNARKKINIQSDVNSIKSLLDNIQAIYTLEGLPPVEGALDLSVEIDELKEVDVSLSSPAIIYHPTRETAHVINDIKLVVSADESKVQLKSYALTYDEMKLFATKPSIVNMNEDIIEISELWLNDQLKVSGAYNTKTAKGNISADAKTLNIAHKIIDLDTAININTVLNADQTSVKGKVILLGGDIHYDMSAKTYPSDSDILIVQDMKKEEASPFMDKLSVQVEVKTKKPLVYKQGPIDIKAIVDLGIHKAEFSELMVLGEVNIIQGGSYTFEGKKFVLDRSNIYFTGNPNKPLLDMSVKYKSLRHLITIGISGTPATPNITFSSVPSLKKEQILSIILFDSEEGAGTNSGEDMMKMMGGAMAKSALTDLGIKLDHLAIGSDGSVEVGKKITDKITFVYVNDEIPQVRVKYHHTPRLESVVSADEESEAYDIVYKRDYSEDDMIIFGKKK